MLTTGQIVLGLYRITEVIAFGGQADVARAVDELTGADVVVKQLTASPGSPHYAVELARFRRAARLQIAHPVVVNPIGHGEEAGDAFTVFPYVSGRELDLYAARCGGRLAALHAVRIIAPLADALAAVHAHGVVHRDVKPGNVLVSDEGAVRLIDFGISRLTHEPTLTTGAGLLGTPSYMAPEQAVRPAGADARADVYALTALLYFLLAGWPPLQVTAPDALLQALQHQVPPPLRQFAPTAPSALEAVCVRGLAKRPDDRFQSMREFASALRGACPAGAASSFCPSCSQAAAHDTSFCAACGAALVAAPPFAPQCLACGAPAGTGSACSACRRPFSLHGHRLEFIGGALAGRIFWIPAGEYVVGRRELLARDQHISRAHLRVVCNDGTVQLRDAGSRNPLQVDGRPLAGACVLMPGVIIDVAHNRAVYHTNF